MVETQIDQLMGRNDRPILRNAILHYSREIAFASAQVWAARGGRVTGHLG